MKPHTSAFTRSFNFIIPILHDGKQIAEVYITAIAYLYRCDGTLRTVDIKSAWFGGLHNSEISGYVSSAQPDTWDEWLHKAEQHYLTLHPEETARNESD